MAYARRTADPFVDMDPERIWSSASFAERLSLQTAPDDEDDGEADDEDLDDLDDDDFDDEDDEEGEDEDGDEEEEVVQR
jgi:hypothetical protein